MLLIVVLLALATVAMGIVLATSRVRYGLPHGLDAATHGLFALATLMVLTVSVLIAGVTRPLTTVFGVLAVAALLGLWLLRKHVRDKRLPWTLLVLHALAALSGLVLLIRAYWLQ